MESKKKAHAVFVFLNVLWIVLILCAALAPLVLLTFFLRWWKTPILIFLGLIAGLSLGTIRERIIFQVGLLMTYLVAILLAFSLVKLGSTSACNLSTYSRYLYVFLTYAVISFVCELVIFKIYRREFQYSPKETENI